jgi:hypothetical protein
MSDAVQELRKRSQPVCVCMDPDNTDTNLRVRIGHARKISLLTELENLF